MTITIDDAAFAKLVAAELAKLMSPEAKPDRLLSCAEAGEQLNLSRQKVRELVLAGHITRVPGITDIRIRQSALDAYGKPEASGK